MRSVSKLVFASLLAVQAAAFPYGPGLAVAAESASPAPPAGDRKAQDVLSHAAAAYHRLSSFSETIDLSATGIPLPTTRCVLKYLSPDKISVRNSVQGRETLAVANGSGIFGTKSVDKTRYLKIPSPKSDQERWQDILFAADGVGLGTTCLLLSGRPLPAREGSLKTGPDDQVDGTPVESVTGTLTTTNGPVEFSFSFGKTDHILRRATLKSAQGTETETHSDVKIDPMIPASAFAFTPPAGAAPVDPTAEPVTYDPRLKPGARPFSFSVKDLDGNPVSLDQYRGKVVLLDFWATWCGYCLMEMPNVSAAYKRFKSQGFDILGVSLDRSDVSVGDLKGFLKSHDMAWRQTFDGKFWTSPVAVKYGIQAIPFSLLIGKDGTILVVNPRGELLVPAIRKALAAK